MMRNAFSAFLCEKLIERDVKGKDAAKCLCVSASYLSDMLRGRRKPPKNMDVEPLCALLNLNAKDQARMYDVLAMVHGDAPRDITPYIMDEELPSLRKVLRRAKEAQMGNAFWAKVVNLIEEREEQKLKYETFVKLTEMDVDVHMLRVTGCRAVTKDDVHQAHEQILALYKESQEATDLVSEVEAMPNEEQCVQAAVEAFEAMGFECAVIMPGHEIIW